MDRQELKKLATASSIIVGTCIGVGFLGLPYVAAQAGYLVAMGYLVLFAAIIIFINLYFGEIILRSKDPHQITGYAERYLGKKWRYIMLAALSIAAYSAILAYMVGVGEGLSYLLTGTREHGLIIGALFGFFMAYIIWGGIKSLTKYERLGVGSIFFLFFLTLFTQIEQIQRENLFAYDVTNLFLPIGVILFSLIEIYSLPEVRVVLKDHEHLMKKAIIIGTITPVIFYAVFTFIVVGANGLNTPEISTFILGDIFILVGMIAMFTSYLALGTALKMSYQTDMQFTKQQAWFIATIIPIGLFLLSRLFDLGFTALLSIGGVVAGGTMVMLLAIINKKAKRMQSDRVPEYVIYINEFIILTICAVFITAMAIKIVTLF